MEAIVLAGGFGTRLASVVQDVPKPMAPVAGKPFLEYILDDLVKQGVTRIILAVHFKKECIIDHFGSSYHGVEVLYSVEESPLFTGGAIKKAMQFCQEEYVWVINGDTYFEVSMEEMRQSVSKSDKAAAIAVKKMKDFDRYGKVDVDQNGNVIAFHEKAPCTEGLINGGIYYLQKDNLSGCPEKFSLENDYFPELLKNGKIGAFISEGYFIDIGIPEDYDRAQRYLRKVGSE